MDRTRIPKPLLEVFSLPLSLDFHVSLPLANAKKKAFQRGSISLREMSNTGCNGRKKEENERLETFERLKNQPTGAADQW
jgi:hypothetical protein